MRPGDVYMINDPYVASTHCNDIHLVKPVFEEDELVGSTHGDHDPPGGAVRDDALGRVPDGDLPTGRAGSGHR